MTDQIRRQHRMKLLLRSTIPDGLLVHHTQRPHLIPFLQETDKSNNIRTPSPPILGRSTTATKTSMKTTLPHKNDVLCGRGGLSNHHPGNRLFRRLIHANKPIYDQNRSSPSLKHFLSLSIIAAIHNINGRFVRQQDGVWTEITWDEAAAKVSQALRETRDLSTRTIVDPPKAQLVSTTRNRASLSPSPRQVSSHEATTKSDTTSPEEDSKVPAADLVTSTTELEQQEYPVDPFSNDLSHFFSSTITEQVLASSSSAEVLDGDDTLEPVKIADIQRAAAAAAATTRSSPIQSSSTIPAPYPLDDDFVATPTLFDSNATPLPSAAVDGDIGNDPLTLEDMDHFEEV